MGNVIFRPVVRQDLDYLFPLLNQLTEIDYSDRDKDQCWLNFISNTSSNSIVGVLNNNVIAYGSIVIENKIRGELAGHIEDVVVDNTFRSIGVGEKLIKELINIAIINKCYRVTLLCNDSLLKFYTKNGFEINNIAMKKYL